jgi:hypothetical protein
LDHRGTEAGAGLARFPYHAWRSGDVLAALQHMVQLVPSARIGLVSFSLNGNMTLKLFGELPDRLPPQLDRALTVNPPINLSACIR